MACFLVSTAEAVIVTAVEKVVEKKEQKREEAGEAPVRHVPLSTKLKWLKYMLLGGSFLLMFEHIWHGVLGVANKSHRCTCLMRPLASIERLICKIVLHGVD